MARNPVASTSALLLHYSFDLHNRSLNQVVSKWFNVYPPKWVVGAVVEAIYQGRYKVASVDCILFLWYLRGSPLQHFDYDFLNIVCSKVLQSVPLHSATDNSPKRAVPDIRPFPRTKRWQQPRHIQQQPKSTAA